MTPGIKTIIAGNWKMNGDRNALNEIRAIATGLGADGPGKPDALICPPATLLLEACTIVSDTPLMIGAQDCHVEAAGAHTGDISAPMIADTGATHIIVGHSERRTDHQESNELVRRKAEAVHGQSLVAIICIGETGQERQSGNTLDVLATQIAGSFPEGSVAGNTILAYEPVWAIGTGLTPSLADIEEAHAFIWRTLADRFGEEGRAMRLLYGGSVKPDNAKDILSVPNVDGALVGGASLKSEDFLAICRAFGHQDHSEFHFEAKRLGIRNGLV